ncbi:hypothetical protein [Sorangium sp. So ce131]|uniref:hypothetical protein n=1 Tax=Sorangium sp. So ce131 TaxID=3133282 RepID=UPI003F5E68EF
MKRAFVSAACAAFAAALAGYQLGCHRERLPQGNGATGALTASTSAATPTAAPAPPDGGAPAAAEGLADVDASRPNIAGSPGAGSPPPPVAGTASASAAGAIAGPGAAVGSAFDQEAWLKARGITWRPDGACWSTLATNPPQRINMCTCRSALALSEIELLVCSRGREQESGAVPFVTHTVLYTPRGGALHVVLDVPTGATLDECAPGNPIPCAVALTLRVDGDAIRLEEAAGTPSACDDPWIAGNKPLPVGSPWDGASAQQVRGTYRRVCGSRGRYTWQRGALRRAP